MEIDNFYKEFIKEELAALWALRARIKSQTYVDHLHKQIEDIRALPRLLASVENQEQGRMFAKKALRKSLLLREKIHMLLKKHGASLAASD